MNEKIRKFKEDLLATGEFKRTTNSTEYRFKYCPFCGDSKMHLYLNIDINSDDPIFYHCFKCNSGGVLKQDMLEQMLPGSIIVPKWGKSRKVVVNGVVSSESVVISENIVAEGDDVSKVQEYIRSRVGSTPSIEDLNKFEYIVRPYDYAKTYLGDEKIRMLDEERFWFRMTNGNMAGRFPNDKEEERRWVKYISNRVSGRGLYRINQAFDMYKPVNVCIAEGVMDLVGLYYNYPISNPIFIAVLGSDYTAGMKYVLERGIFGKGVNIKIFKDADVPMAKMVIPRRLMQFFQSVDIYENKLAKDTGVLPEKLDIQRVTFKGGYCK